MLEKVAAVILAFKRRLLKHLKKRSPSERLNAKRYYRKHKARIKMQRRRYSLKTKLFRKSKKLFKRTKPKWLHRKKTKAPRPKVYKHPVNKIVHKPPAARSKPSKVSKPPKARRKFKAHAPRRK